MKLDQSVTDIKGVGEQVAKKLKTLGSEKVSDIIYYFPFRYEDYSHVMPIEKIRPGQVTIKAEVKQARGRWGRRGIHVTEAVATDESGSVRIVWFNQPYRQRAIKPKEKYFISGNFDLSHGRLTIINPSMELVSDFPLNTARIVPIYRLTKGLSQQILRRAMSQLFGLIRALPDDFPPSLRKKHSLISHAEAAMALHFPKEPGDVEKAQKRLGFEEMLAMNLASLMNFNQNQSLKAPKVEFNERLARNFVKHLPFRLTDAQRKVVWQIYLDLKESTPCNRLIEGDVGSGKTVVAVMAALMVMQSGYQAALMAPTEVLARQHGETIHKILAPLKLQDKVGLLVGSMSAKQKEIALRRIKNGEIGLIIGTHALIEGRVEMNKVGLVIVDEQHRFGVEQRKKLQSKAEHALHVLTMSATPIPRSLALTLYGELKISKLDLIPSGRKPVVTHLVPPTDRLKIYESVKKELDKGRQAFVICPQIVEGLGGKSIESVYKELSQKHFSRYKVGLLHGKQKADVKEETMRKFSEGEIDLLVSTTVIEVGVDVPNATAVLIESPERFGLAQIHQLRGRVGRGRHQSHCYLMLEENKAPSLRLRELEKSNNGFKLAELDLKLRGPGAIYGQRQHGLLDLEFADLNDIKTLKAIKSEAKELLSSNEDLSKYPRLEAKVQKLRKVINLN